MANVSLLTFLEAVPDLRYFQFKPSNSNAIADFHR